MFGNKQNKRKRLKAIADNVTKDDGITQAELAHRLGVSRGTISKDMGIIEKLLGIRFWEDDDARLYRCDDE